jgi:hypothetical protein
MFFLMVLFGAGNGMNGDSMPPVDTGQQAELAEERKVIQQVLSSTPDPAVSLNTYTRC